MQVETLQKALRKQVNHVDFIGKHLPSHLPAFQQQHQTEPHENSNTAQIDNQQNPSNQGLASVNHQQQKGILLCAPVFSKLVCTPMCDRCSSNCRVFKVLVCGKQELKKTESWFFLDNIWQKSVDKRIPCNALLGSTPIQIQ